MFKTLNVKFYYAVIINRNVKENKRFLATNGFIPLLIITYHEKY